jgi:hypothetical protein
MLHIRVNELRMDLSEYCNADKCIVIFEIIFVYNWYLRYSAPARRFYVDSLGVIYSEASILK